MPSRNAIEIVITATDDASKALESTDSLLANIGKTAAIGAAALVTATVAIGAGLLDLAKDAAPVEGITNAFNALAASAGKSGKALIDAMKKQSMGLVDDTDLMLQYNKAAQVMGSTLAGQLPDAYQYLAKVAASSGQDVGQLMDTLVQGVGRVTPRMMTQLGVTVDMDQANKDYAKSLGKSVDQLTKADKQTAIFNATMEALKKNTAAMPDVTNNASTKMQQFSVKLEDIKETVGVALLPMLGQFMDFLGKLADKVLPIIIPLIEQIGGGFETFFKALNDGVDPLTAIGDGLFKVFGDGAKPIAQILATLGSLVSSFFDGIRQGVNPLEALGAALLDTFGNSPLLLGFANILVQVGTGIETLIGVINNFGNTVKNNGIVTAIMSIVNAFLQMFGLVKNDDMSPFLDSLIKAIDGFVASVQTFVQQNPAFIVALGLIAATVGIVAGVLGVVSIATGVFTGAVGILGGALGILLSPIVLVSAAIAGIIFAADKLYPGGIVKLFKDASVAAKELAFLGMYVLASAASWAQQKVAELLKTLMDAVGTFQSLGGIGNLLTTGQITPQQLFSAIGNQIGANAGGSSLANNLAAQAAGHALGLKNVPEDGMYKLHKGEGVTTAAENQYGGNNGSIAINFYGGQGINNQADANDAGFMVVGALRQNGVNI